MITVAEYNESFIEAYRREKRRIIVYGAGATFRRIADKLEHIDYLIDARWEKIQSVENHKVDDPNILWRIKEDAYMIICVNNEDAVKEIVNRYESIKADILCFIASHNIDFSGGYWDALKSYSVTDHRENKEIYINIVCSDNGWIFQKFAIRMKEVLDKYGFRSDISASPSSAADINHHIPYIAFDAYPKDTLMITHVDCMKKVDMLKQQLEIAGMGVCMSKQTMESLITYGVRRDKLCYINPAHDENIKPKKYVIGISHKCRSGVDTRKRESALLDILEGINPNYFDFVIIGEGWDAIVSIIRDRGFGVEYYDRFEYDIYPDLICKMDYFLYLGFDEGTMGYLDALQAGLGTIVTPQGYHLDTDCTIDYPCRTVKQFREAFLDLQLKRERKVKAVQEWTWDNYVLKHMEIWDYLLRRKGLGELYKNQMIYEDGIFSALIEDNRM